MPVLLRTGRQRNRRSTRYWGNPNTEGRSFAPGACIRYPLPVGRESGVDEAERVRIPEVFALHGWAIPAGSRIEQPYIAGTSPITHIGNLSTPPRPAWGTLVPRRGPQGLHRRSIQRHADHLRAFVLGRECNPFAIGRNGRLELGESSLRERLRHIPFEICHEQVTSPVRPWRHFKQDMAPVWQNGKWSKTQIIRRGIAQDLIRPSRGQRQHPELCGLAEAKKQGDEPIALRGKPQDTRVENDAG